MTNKAAIGYMILAAKVLKMDDYDIRQLENEMISQMDENTEEEAEKEYKNF